MDTLEQTIFSELIVKVENSFEQASIADFKTGTKTLILCVTHPNTPPEEGNPFEVIGVIILD